MSEGQAIRHTSNALLAHLSELEELERTKRDLAPGSKAQVRLTRRVESLARKVLYVAGQQTDLVEAVSAMTEGGAPAAESTPRETHLILADWRDAERALEREVPGTPGWEAARTVVDRLRGEYRRAFEVKGEHS
jgi:hypothetical protein